MKQNIFIALALVLALVIVLAALGINVFKEPVGSLFVEEHAYGEGDVTYSTNTLNTGAEEVLAKATSSRSYAEICHSPVNTTADPIFLFKQGTSTSVAVNSGKALHATSSANGANCMRLDSLDPYLGAVWAISVASTTLTIESVQN